MDLDRSHDVSALSLVERAVDDDFRRWRHGVDEAAGATRNEVAPCPAPDEGGGLPAGWRIVAHSPSDSPIHFWLIRRADGGWIILQHNLIAANTNIRWIDVTLSDLYVHVVEILDKGEGPPDELQRFRGWLRQVLLDMFSPDDPAEVAMRTMFALGAPLVTPPRAAL